ncbi:MAG TPA: hypothetical protein QF604_05935 [Candidatus Latescibacteria bacterium]|nr:hypothetical protein [Candidatus Latescibacterota bacterium]MDP7365014.1 hypothetical protein [Candidatus Latescibacterota bacterium]MDP7634510.1 hypothetical protein [Candidatus Latescibacterota bacterium]MEC8992402.1 hypothetical protein [Candidatus Latescibacterota bacterium]MEE3040266.1 hypothetical protein [Candidatus Latescibacterota bacterium]
MSKPRDLADPCCLRYLKKKKACKDCPLTEGLSKKKRKKLLKRLRQEEE